MKMELAKPEATRALERPVVRIPPDTEPLPASVTVSIHLCALVLVTAALYFARDFFLPVVLAFLFALTLIPIVRSLARRGVPSGLTAAALVLALAIGLGAAGYFLSGPVAKWIDQAPNMGRQIETKLRSLRGSVEAVAKATKQVDDLSKTTADPGVQEVVLKEKGFLSSATSTLWSGVTITGVALILVLFLLASGDMLYEKIIRVLPTLSDKKKALRIVHDIEASISRYLLTVALINVTLGTAIGLLLWWIGMPNPFLWGIGAAILNFLPYLGAFTGIVLTALVAFVTFDSLAHAALAPLLYLACATVEGQILTPLIMGRRLELNTVAVFIGVAFWGWVWGLVGIFMAVPILVILKTFCEHFPRLTAFGEFLSSAPPKIEEAERKDLHPIGS